MQPCKLAAGVLLAVSLFIGGAAHLRAADTDLLAGDERLTRRVGLQVPRETVGRVLARLHERTGVAVSAAPKVEDLWVTAFLADVPLRDVMRRLATLLHLTWQRAGEGGRSEYVLSMSKEDAALATRLKAEDDARFKRLVLRMVRLEQRPEPPADVWDQAALRHLSHPQIRVGTRLLGSVPGPALDALMRGETMTAAYPDLPAPLRAAVAEYQRTSHSQALAIQKDLAAVAGANGEALPPRPADPTPLEKSVLTLSIDPEPEAIRVALSGSNGMRFDCGRLTTAEQLSLQRHFDSRDLVEGFPPSLRLPYPSLPWEEWLAQFSRDNRISVLSDAFDPSILGDIDPSY